MRQPSWEVGADVGSMATDDGSCCIVEVIIVQLAGLRRYGRCQARRRRCPHIILLPEIRLNEETFLAKVKETVDRIGYCVVVAGEGVKTAGEEIGADKTRLDAFGHPVLSGAADALKDLVQAKLNLKTRTVKLGYAQRAAAHYASAIDSEEAHACGVAAVKAAMEGKSGMMVKLVRLQNEPYQWGTALQPLEDIANVEHFIPRSMDYSGWDDAQ